MVRSLLLLTVLLLPAAACSGPSSFREDGDSGPIPEAVASAERRFIQGDTSGAVRRLLKHIEETPDSFHGLYVLGAIEVLEQSPEAQERLDAAARLAPSHPGPVFFSGFERFRAAPDASADAVMERGLRLARAREGWRLGLRDTTDTVRRALEALEQSRPREAATLLEEEAARSGPGVVCLLGRARLAAGDLAGALASAEVALGVDPGFAPAHLLVARCRFAEDDFDGSRAAVERALEAEPRFPDALYLSGMLHAAASDYTDAFSDLWRAVLEDPTVPAYYDFLGSRLINFGRPDQGSRILLLMEWTSTFLGRRPAGDPRTR